MLCATISWAANPSGGVITTTVRTNTTALIRVTTAPTAVDSVHICYISGSDTLYAAKIDTTTTNKVISGFSPGTTKTFFLLVNQGTRAAGKAAISDKDTVTFYSPGIEATPNTNISQLTEQMIRAVSWRPTSVLTAFTVNGPTGADSTGHYNLWKNNAFVFKASQAGDSVKVMAYFAYGYRDMTQTGDTFGFTAYADSININAPGIFRKMLTTSTLFGMMYIKFDGWSGNGKNAAIEVYSIRDRY